MPKRVCPWWVGYLLASPLRRVIQDPATILAPHVRPGMMVLEPGPGMGFFTLELARLVGDSGRVIAVDIQPRMITALKRRLDKAGLQARVDARVASPEALGVADLHGRVDFVLAFAVVHELPNPAAFFHEVADALKIGGTMLLAEPSGHVRAGDFEAEIELARQASLNAVDGPSIRRSRAALLQKG